MRKFVWSFVLLAACVTPTKPPVIVPATPSEHRLTVHVCEGSCVDDRKLPGVTVRVVDDAANPNYGATAVSDGAGNIPGWTLKQAGFTICAQPDGFKETCTGVTLTSDREANLELTRAIPPMLPLHADGRLFRTSDGALWRWKGVTGFRLLDTYAHGQDLQPFFDRFRGFNVLRVFLYTSWKDSNGHSIGWDAPDPGVVLRFLTRCEQAGFRAELVLFTDNDPARVPAIHAIVDAVTAAHPVNAFFEIGNEPDVNGIDTTIARSWVEGKGVLYSSGDYDPSNKHFGDYLTYHTPRDSEWPRKAKGLREFWDGGGPDYPTEPALHIPAVADEPIRPDQAGYVATDYLAYFGIASISGAGATFHYEGGKWARLPNAQEGACLDAALAGLNAFPVDAALGAYSRPDDSSLRTYIVGNVMVRVRPTTDTPPFPGWTSLEPSHTLWSR